MKPLLLVLLAALLVLLNGFFVAAEFALVKIRSGQVEALVRRRALGAETVRRSVNRLDRVLSTCQVGITLASLGLGWIGEPALARLLEPVFRAAGLGTPVAVHSTAGILAFLAITFLHVVLGEQVPKAFAIQQPERTSLLVSPPLRVFEFAIYPLIWLLNASANLALRALGFPAFEWHDRAATPEELRLLVSQSRAAGQVPPDRARAMAGLLDLSEKSVRQIMVPRHQVTHLDLTLPLEENLRTADSSGHTRYPVCDGDLDRIAGILHVKDLYPLRERADLDLRRLLRPAALVPETLSAEELLRLFQKRRQHLAAVVDEHGGVAGIVTLEDVLEEVFGEIQDEFDEEVPRVRSVAENQWLVDGVTPLREVSVALSHPFEEESSDSIAGAVQSRLGHLARAGDEARIGPFVFRVEEMQRHRIARLLARREP